MRIYKRIITASPRVISPFLSVRRRDNSGISVSNDLQWLNKTHPAVSPYVIGKPLKERIPDPSVIGQKTRQRRVRVEKTCMGLKNTRPVPCIFNPMMQLSESICIGLKVITLKLIIIIILFLAVAMPIHSQKLKIGDNAPQIIVYEWINAEPIIKFEKGTIYVVEFTGSNCVPCRAVAPHLSELAYKHRAKVKVLGICVWENASKNDTSYLKRVRKFVNTMGNKMSYPVAVDVPEQTMGENWMKAAGQNAIPAVFVIDQSQKIAWIGHPNYIDLILEGLIKNGVVSNCLVELIENSDKKIGTAIRNEDYDLALKIVDSLIDKFPGNELMKLRRFEILLFLDENKAYEFGLEVLKSKEPQEALPLYFAKRILGNSKLKCPNWNLAIEFCQYGISQTKDSLMKARFYQMLAELYATKLNKHDEAIKFQESALKCLSGYDISDPFIRQSVETVNIELTLYKSHK